MKRVCVIGGGLAGLVCALSAASRGMKVKLFDANPKRGASLTHHVVIEPSTMRDLATLGIGDDCVREGFAFHGIHVLDRQGRLSQELPTVRIAGIRYPAAIGITVGRLSAIVAAAANARGAQLLLDESVVAVKHNGDGTTSLTLSSGGVEHADLVVLACGPTSPLRAELFPQAQAVANLGQAWSCTKIQRPNGMDRPVIAIGGAGRKAILVPVSHDVTAVTLVEPSTQNQPETPTSAHLRKSLARFAPAIRDLAPYVDDDSLVSRLPARSGMLAPPWHNGPVIAVGECAHTLPPHLGQGAAQAIEDAIVLGDLIDKHGPSSTLSAQFTERRFERVDRVHHVLSDAYQWYLEPEGDTDLKDASLRVAQIVGSTP